MPYVAYAEQPAYRVAWHSITRVWRDLAHATAANTPAGSAIYESSKDNPGLVAEALEGWYVNTQDGTIAADLPADTSDTAQRDEIADILREQYRAFDFDRWALVDTASRPVKQMILKYLRMVYAYALASDTDERLDECKTGARRDLNEIAEYADASAWDTGLDTAGYRVFTRNQGDAADSVALPDPLAGMPTLTAQQITGTDLAALLR